MKKGIIVEMNERFLTLLTDEGEFLRGQKQNSNYEIGQEIDYFPFEEKKPFFNWLTVKTRPAMVFTLLMMMIIAFSFLPFTKNNEIYAYMSIDINPSFELGVNEQYRVIEVVPYNNDGVKIIEEMSNWRNKHIDAVITEMIQELKNQGYVVNKKDVLIATVLAKEGKANSNNPGLKKEINFIKSEMEKEELNVSIMHGTNEERQKAKEIGVTVGQFKEKQNKQKHDNQQWKEDIQSKKVRETRTPDAESEIKERNRKQEQITTQSANQVDESYEQKTKKAEYHQQGRQNYGEGRQERKEEQSSEKIDRNKTKDQHDDNHKSKSNHQDGKKEKKQYDSGNSKTKHEEVKREKNKYERNDHQKNSHQKNDHQKNRDAGYKKETQSHDERKNR